MADLFKFRCYQCQKLIGAPPSRYGTIVKCPKCAVDLIVPSPDDEDQEGPTGADDADSFRPEDLGLRLEPEPLARAVAAPPPPLQPVGPDPIAFLARIAEAGETPPPGPADSPDDASEPSELIQPGEEPLVPRKRGRRPSTSNLIEPPTKARDVILPRTAAVAWAMFALMALAFAFTSGLFVGHTLWK